MLVILNCHRRAMFNIYHLILFLFYFILFALTLIYLSFVRRILLSRPLFYLKLDLMKTLFVVWALNTKPNRSVKQFMFSHSIRRMKNEKQWNIRNLDVPRKRKTTHKPTKHSMGNPNEKSQLFCIWAAYRILGIGHRVILSDDIQ